MKRFLAAAYALVSYVVFLAAFLYAIGFVGNLLVPKSIDSGQGSDLFTALLVNLGLMSLFALQHSIMARPAFKRAWTRIIPAVIERSTYVLLSSLILFLLYWQWRPLTDVIWQVESGFLTALLLGLFALGWFIVLISTFMISHFDLFGLRQVYAYVKKIEPQPLRFRLTMLYSIVRHPIMLGFIIAFWATPQMTVGHLLFAAVTTAYIFVAVAFLEERDLIAMHGEDYREYQRKVPMLIPFTKSKKANKSPGAAETT